MPIQAPAIIANMNLAIEGIGKSATCTSFQRPEIAFKTESFAGMVADYEAFGNLEALTAEFTLADVDPSAIMLLNSKAATGIQNTLKHAGAIGNSLKGIGLGSSDVMSRCLSGKMLTLYGSLQQGNSAVAITCYLRGRAKKRATNAFKPNEKLEETYTLALDFYQEVRDGATLLKIDLQNDIISTDGVNYYAEHKLNCGK
jgi:phage tail tube protein FII